MSRVHQQRAEDAVEAARNRAKERLRLLQAVLAHWEEGLTARASAERVAAMLETDGRQRSLHVTTVRRWRRFLGLSYGGRDVGASLRRG